MPPFILLLSRAIGLIFNEQIAAIDFNLFQRKNYKMLISFIQSWLVAGEPPHYRPHTDQYHSRSSGYLRSKTAA